MLYYNLNWFYKKLKEKKNKEWNNSKLFFKKNGKKSRSSKYCIKSSWINVILNPYSENNVEII